MESSSYLQVFTRNIENLHRLLDGKVHACHRELEELHYSRYIAEIGLQLNSLWCHLHFQKDTGTLSDRNASEIYGTICQETHQTQETMWNAFSVGRPSFESNIVSSLENIQLSIMVQFLTFFLDLKRESKQVLKEAENNCLEKYQVWVTKCATADWATIVSEKSVSGQNLQESQTELQMKQRKRLQQLQLWTKTMKSVYSSAIRLNIRHKSSFSCAFL